MTGRSIEHSGTLSVGQRVVHRLGFGAMRITGAGIWGPPEDPDECVRVLRRAVELGVDFIDTADSYGPYVSEELIHQALAPYPPQLVIATKAGLVRTGPDVWHPVGRPEYLRQECEMSLRRLGVDRLDLFQLHRIDPLVPAEEQFGLLSELRREGKVGEVGLSEVSIADLEAAREMVPIATVQNLYNVANRSSEGVLDYCTAHDIGFIPWFPIAAGALARREGTVGRVAKRVGEVAVQAGATPAQVALAWLLARSPVMVPIPGTSSVAHLEENCGAATLALSPEQVESIDAATG